MDLTLKEYYNIIKAKIQNKDYILKSRKSYIETTINPHLEAINYLQFEFMKDRKDDRAKKIFDHVYIPNNVNIKDLDIDFTKYSTEDFLIEIMKLKD